MATKKLMFLVVCVGSPVVCLKAANLEKMMEDTIRTLVADGIALNKEQEKFLQSLQEKKEQQERERQQVLLATQRKENQNEIEMKDIFQPSDRQIQEPQELDRDQTCSSLSQRGGLGSRVVNAVRSVLAKSLFTGGIVLSKEEDKSEK